LRTPVPPQSDLEKLSAPAEESFPTAGRRVTCNVMDAPRRCLGHLDIKHLLERRATDAGLSLRPADPARRWRAMLVDALRLATYSAAMPLPRGFVPPCLPTKAPQPPSGDTWVHEIKHDGFRVIARKDGEGVRLYSRPGNDLTYRHRRRARPPALALVYHRRRGRVLRRGWHAELRPSGQSCPQGTVLLGGVAEL
jgi:hypothetical protein